MGDYANDAINEDIKRRFGFDPEITFIEKKRVPSGKIRCPICKRFLKKKGLKDHTKAAHGS